MKIKIMTGLMILAAISICKESSAQFSAGVKAGLNVTNFSKSEDFKTTTKTGITLGGYAAYQVIPKLQVQLEALYATQGATEDDKYGGGTYNFNYIQLPLTVKYNVWNSLYAITGPQAGFLVSAKTKAGGEKEDIKENVKSTDMTWVFGVGYELDNGLSADIRYMPGLADISRNDNDIRNKCFRITLGYRLWKNK